jgi:hypothetical protein
MFWIPALLAASALYWSTALGLGYRSLAWLAPADEEAFVVVPAAVPTEEGEGILVHLVSSSEAGLEAPPAPRTAARPSEERDPIGRTAY